MFPKKEFYFIRHGQTDYNLLHAKVDHEDVSLNGTGVQQALAVEGIIATLPIRSVCYSPLKRAKETKEIISLRLLASHFEIPELGECSMEVWNEMRSCGANAHQSAHKSVRAFMQRTVSGVNQALSRDGPILIVAHGGIHWTMCCLMSVVDHEWTIANCLPVHFFPGSDGEWKANKILGNSL